MTDLLAEQDTPALQQLPVRAAKQWVGVSYLLILFPKEELIKADLKRKHEKISPICTAGTEL